MVKIKDFLALHDIHEKNISINFIDNSNNYFLKTKNDYFEYKKSNYVNYRMDNYKYLEDFFEKYNFEIIDNINEFYAFSENFIDQINFFNEVKTLISVSGSGLTNSLFMQKNTNLIELITPFNIFYCSKFINEKSKNLKI